MDFDNAFRTYHDIKIYQINRNHYDLKKYNNPKGVNNTIEFIINYHKENFKPEVPTNKISRHQTQYVNSPVLYELYAFQEFDQDSTWKKFFPEELADIDAFKIVSSSFCLFISIEEQIFAVIGGKGISVIIRFINPTFGIDVFEKFADPEFDIVYSQSTRGVTGTLSSETKTYRKEQRLIDSISLGNVPKKLIVGLRNEIRDSLFDFIDFGENDNICLEVGSSFCIKWKLTFDNLHDLSLIIVKLLKISDFSPLGRFEKISEDDPYLDVLKGELILYLRNDMVNLVQNQNDRSKQFDYDFVHPSKLDKFFESTVYKVFKKHSVNPIFEETDRSLIYSKTLSYVFHNCDYNNIIEFRKLLSGIKVRAFKGNTFETIAPFVNHITCEISVNNVPFFLIDNVWYRIKGNFIEILNNACAAYFRTRQPEKMILTHKWNIKENTEGEYNNLYSNNSNFIVLDKILSQNIELCDILHYDEDNLYLIHVKKGFDAKIRDLTNQISISANRLGNDLKSDKKFISELHNRYILSKSIENKLNKVEFFSLFEKNIKYVLAFGCNNISPDVGTNITAYNSNIAKFSILQIFSELSQNSYPLYITEITS